MATTEMNCLASGGAALKEVDGSITVYNGNNPETVSGLSQIKYVRWDRASQGYHSQMIGESDLLVDDTLFKVNTGGVSVNYGVDSISDNTFNFYHDSSYSAVITYTAVGY